MDNILSIKMKIIRMVYHIKSLLVWEEYKMNRKILSLTSLVLLVMLLISLFFKLQPEVFEVKDNEIGLEIQLELEEDIGALIYDYYVNQRSVSSGGVMNSDRSLTKRNDRIRIILDSEELGHQMTIDTLAIDFAIVTDTIEPNFENNYPPELVIPLERLVFEPTYGEVYQIMIRGDQSNGYTAELMRTNSQIHH